MSERLRYLKNVKTLVVKVGTANVTDSRSRLDPRRVEKIVHDIMEVKKNKKRVVLVTSGAIGAGIGRMNLKERPKEMPLLQAAAAIGQGILMQTYEHYFSRYNQPIAQILLTAEDFSDTKRYDNFLRTMRVLLDLWDAIPIINENDTIATDEIRFGDNDILSAYVAIGIRADLLVILSDVDGLYTADPSQNEQVLLIDTVPEITQDIENMAGRSSKGFGFGGMLSKIQAAKMTTSNGIPLIIANGNEENVLKRILRGERIGTIFLPRGKNELHSG